MQLARFFSHCGHSFFFVCFFAPKTDGHVHYRDIELIASKTYIREVVLIIIYSEGSFFVTLSAGVGDQPLLDMSFPDVSSRGRGYQIAQYNHSVYRKLSLWQSSRSVWEARIYVIFVLRGRLS